MAQACPSEAKKEKIKADEWEGRWVGGLVVAGCCSEPKEGYLGREEEEEEGESGRADPWDGGSAGSSRFFP